jgi:hypothetical protein
MMPAQQCQIVKGVTKAVTYHMPERDIGNLLKLEGRRGKEGEGRRKEETCALR